MLKYMNLNVFNENIDLLSCKGAQYTNFMFVHNKHK